MWRDVRLAARSLRRAPGFTLSAIVTLGLALGAAIAIFTVVNATMLTPPPYPDPDRILVFATPSDGGPGTGEELAFLRERSRSFSVIAGQQTSPGWNLIAGNHAEFVEGLEITDGYFDVHGIPLLIGRGISAQEAQPRGPRAVVLSEPLWHRVFGGRPDVLGELIEIGGRPHEIVGIAPRHFQPIPAAQVWTPLQVSPQSNAANVRILARLAPGRTRGHALEELNAWRADLRALSSNQRRRAQRPDLVTWMSYQEWFSARTAELMFILIGAVAALLLVGCVNIGGLQVARGLARTGEFAARAALGASRLRLFREAFAESLLLASAASVMGLALAAVGTQTLLSLLPPDLLANMFSGASVRIDRTIVALTLLAGAGCAVVFGFAPALASAYVDLRSAAGDSRVTASRSAIWIRRAFATGQVALALVLLIGAGLLIRTFETLRSADLGFRPDDIVIGEMAIQGEEGDMTAHTLFVENALERIRRIDAVDAVAVASAVPVDRPVNFAVQAQGDALLPEPRAVDWGYATPEYFDLFSIPLQAGRLIDARDAQSSGPVAVVNAAFAREFFGRVHVIGETIQTLGIGDPVRLIVGVVGDVRARSGSSFARSFIALAGPPSPMVYVPLSQLSPHAFRNVH